MEQCHFVNLFMEQPSSVRPMTPVLQQ